MPRNPATDTAATTPTPGAAAVNTMALLLGDKEFHVRPDFGLLERVERKVGGVIPFLDRLVSRRFSIGEVVEGVTAIVTAQPGSPKASEVGALMHAQPKPDGQDFGGHLYYVKWLVDFLSGAVTGGRVGKEAGGGNGEDEAAA